MVSRSSNNSCFSDCQFSISCNSTTHAAECRSNSASLKSEIKNQSALSKTIKLINSQEWIVAPIFDLRKLTTSLTEKFGLTTVISAWPTRVPHTGVTILTIHAINSPNSQLYKFIVVVTIKLMLFGGYSNTIVNKRKWVDFYFLQICLDERKMKRNEIEQ